MSRVAKSAVITNKADRVIDYLADVKNHPAFLGPLKSVANVNGDPKKAGTSWDWTFVMGGVAAWLPVYVFEPASVSVPPLTVTPVAAEMTPLIVVVPVDVLLLTIGPAAV